MGGIRLSPKHGVNPSMGQCFYCGEADGSIILPGKMKGDMEAPRQACWSKEPCPQCKEWMAKGIIFISVKDGETGDNPYRTGRFAVVKEEAVRRFITSPDALEDVCKRRVCFMEDTSWDIVGLDGAIPEEHDDGVC